MNEAHASPGALTPNAAIRRSDWTAGRITALVVGALLVLVSLVLLGAGGTALWADRTQRDDGYVTTDVHKFSTPGSALATEETDLGTAGVGWLYSPGVLDEIRIRVTRQSPGPKLFVGIARSSDVDRYLAGVNHTLISEFFDDKVQTIDGRRAPSSPPGAQAFWVASASGAGTQTVTWNPADGVWTVVVMNADGRPGVAVAADLGASIPALPWVAVGVLVAGGVFLLAGALLIGGAIRDRRAGRASTA